MKNRKTVIIMAGETSGDMHGAKLVKKMLQKDPKLTFYGMGGEALKSAGVKNIIDASKISIVGIAEVFSKLYDIIKTFRQAKKLLKKIRPNLLILIDFPEFNLALAKTAKKLGIPALYYISPQIWAWRSGRVKKIKKLVNHIAVILPFEEKFYTKHNIPVTYVGHPLLDTNKKILNKTEQNKTVIGLIPGSREKEITNNLPEILKACEIIGKKNRKIEFIYAMAPGLNLDNILKIIKENTKTIKINIEKNGIEKVLEKVNFVIAGSGTATLQTALFKVPMIVIYKTSKLSYNIAKKLINVNYISLVNLIADKKIVPELIQDEATSQNIAAEAEKILNNPLLFQKTKEELLSLQKIMGEKGASAKVADIAFKIMGREEEFGQI